MFLPSGLVVGTDVRDREAVECAALGHEDTGLLSVLTAAVQDCHFRTFEAIGSLGVIPFAPQDDAWPELNAFLILTGGNRDRVAWVS